MDTLIEIKNKFEKTQDMPWAAGFELRRIISIPYIRLMFFLHGIKWGKNWLVWGMPMIQHFRASRIEIGDGINLRSWRATNPLVVNHPIVLATRSAKAVIKIGKDVGMTGTTIVAAEYIEIGDRVLIGSNATIVDTDFHPLDPETRRRDILAGKHAPVIIENDVFIGMNSLILKGVKIGAEAVVGAGSVVTTEIPPRMIAAGNPARIVGSIKQMIDDSQNSETR